MTLPILAELRAVFCDCCGRLVPTGRRVAGLGEKCARRAGLVPPRQPRTTALFRVQDGPDLLDLITPETTMPTPDPRRAVVVIPLEALARAMGLPDGVHTVSVAAGWEIGGVKLLVAGDGLPLVDECAEAPTTRATEFGGQLFADFRDLYGAVCECGHNPAEHPDGPCTACGACAFWLFGGCA